MKVYVSTLLCSSHHCSFILSSQSPVQISLSHSQFCPLLGYCSDCLDQVLPPCPNPCHTSHHHDAAGEVRAVHCGGVAVWCSHFEQNCAARTCYCCIHWRSESYVVENACTLNTTLFEMNCHMHEVLLTATTVHMHTLTPIIVPTPTTCRTKFLRSNPRLVLPVQAVVATLCFGLALPVAISIFPQKSQVREQGG